MCDCVCMTVCVHWWWGSDSQLHIGAFKHCTGNLAYHHIAHILLTFVLQWEVLDCPHNIYAANHMHLRIVEK